MLKKALYPFIALTLVATFLLSTFANPVQAATSVDPSQLNTSLEKLESNVKDLSENFSDASVNELDEIKSQISDDSIKLNNTNLDFDNAYAKENDSVKIVYIPIIKEGIKEELNQSQLSVFLNKDDSSLLTYVELDITGDDVNYTADTKVYTMGNLVKEETLQLDQTYFETASEDKGFSTMGFSWQKTKDCFNDAGVASWAVAALAVACSAICIGTVGAGCVVCLSSAGLITEGVIVKCTHEGFRG